MSFDWIYLAYLFFFCMAIGMLRLAWSMVMPGIRQYRMESAVRKTGIGVNADIIHRRKTDLIDGEMPVYQLTFAFTTQQGVEVRATLERPLDMDGFARYAPGNSVALKYDPHNPQRIALYPNDRPLILGD